MVNIKNWDEMPEKEKIEILKKMILLLALYAGSGMAYFFEKFFEQLDFNPRKGK